MYMCFIAKIYPLKFMKHINRCFVKEGLYDFKHLNFRVVNISSTNSQWAIEKCSDEVRSKFLQPDITMDKLKGLIQQFIE